LEINSLVDERRDPLKATYAACQFLRDLYNIHNDWTLAIAAYNCGSGNVNKAIRRANGRTDYWEIYPYLPKETRMYVPLFVAATYVMNFYAQHQLYPVQTDMPPLTDTVMVNQPIHFDQIAAVLGIEKEFIRSLNPQYKQDIIPGNSKPRALKLPTMKAYAFVELQDSIAKYRADELFTNRVSESTGNTTEKVSHVVKNGETLISIANRYGVTTASIRKWNGLRSNRVAPGRKLVIYADNGGYALSSSSPAGNAGSNSTASKQTPFAAYKVKKGDTLSSIAQKYNCTQTELKQLNGMKNSSLKIGQYIRIPLKQKK
jgi:membrane-bound lytic murein transglycosylase D